MDMVKKLLKILGVAIMPILLFITAFTPVYAEGVSKTFAIDIRRSVNSPQVLGTRNITFRYNNDYEVAPDQIEITPLVTLMNGREMSYAAHSFYLKDTLEKIDHFTYGYLRGSDQFFLRAYKEDGSFYLLKNEYSGVDNTDNLFMVEDFSLVGNDYPGAQQEKVFAGWKSDFNFNKNNKDESQAVFLNLNYLNQNKDSLYKTYDNNGMKMVLFDYQASGDPAIKDLPYHETDYDWSTYEAIGTAPYDKWRNPSDIYAPDGNDGINKGVEFFRFAPYGRNDGPDGYTMQDNEVTTKTQHFMSKTLTNGIPSVYPSFGDQAMNNESSKKSLDYLFDVDTVLNRMTNDANQYLVSPALALPVTKPYSMFNLSEDGITIQYDSDVNSVRYNYDTMDFTLGDPDYSIGGYAGWFPFGVNNYNRYHNGLSIEREFYIPINSEKKLMANDGTYKDMVYEFTGDDDMVVYIDDELFLDLSGIHSKEVGEINFTQGYVKLGAWYGGRNWDQLMGTETIIPFSDLVSDPSVIDEDGTFKEGTMHKLNMFYLERGGNLSNLKVTMNIQNGPAFCTVDGEGGRTCVRKKLMSDFATPEKCYSTEPNGQGEIVGPGHTFTATEDIVLYEMSSCPVTGSTTKLKKHMVVKKDAEIPNVEFQFTVSAGQPINASEISPIVYAGVTPEKVTVNGEAQTGSVFFSPEDSTVSGETNDIATTNDKYATKDITLGFGNVNFSQPGVYRYVITENAHTWEAVTIDTEPVRVVDVYVEWNNAETEVEVAGYVSYLGNVTDAPRLMPEFTYNYTDTNNDGTISQEEKDAQADDYNAAYSDFVASIQDGSGKPAGSYANADEPIGVEAGDKSNEYVNRLDTANLSLTKIVSGNQGSKDQYFEFVVTIDNAGSMTEMTLDMSQADLSPTANGGTSFTASNMASANQIDEDNIKNGQQIVADAHGHSGFTVYLQHGQTMVLKGLPKGTTYTITETQEAGYNTTSENASGTISTDDVSSVYRNDKSGVIPTGILLQSTGAFALLGICLVGLFLTKKTKLKEE